MAYNKLRRDISTALASGLANGQDVRPLLDRALSALGGPVEDNRPTGVIVGEELPVAPVAVLVGDDLRHNEDPDDRLELSPAEVDEYVGGLGEVRDSEDLDDGA